MSEHAPHVDEHDAYGKLVGIQVAILAVLLSVFTIFAHREHTTTILLANESSNAWAHYQAKRIRAYQLEMNSNLIKLIAPSSTEVTNTLKEYGEQTATYDKELEGIKKDAELKETTGELAHHKASFFDLAEGIFEIAVVLSSMYFLSRKRFFPMLGLFGGLAGLAIGILGVLLK